MAVSQVAADQTNCLQYGGANCKLNYETTRSHNIIVKSTDNGSPPLSKTFNLTISIANVNDKPRGLSIDKFRVRCAHLFWSSLFGHSYLFVLLASCPSAYLVCSCLSVARHWIYLKHGLQNTFVFVDTGN